MTEPRGAPTVEGVRTLESAASVDEAVKIRRRMTHQRTEVIGVRTGTVFDIAKANERMLLSEVDRLLDSDAYEMRMVAVSILDFPGPDEGRRPRRAVRAVDAAARPHRHVGLPSGS
ncbi:DNA alkylation repair protein [Microbacterium sp. LWH3-1.2]|uniref:DNA alkylation repair protein n=1 Tax=Microbacterium sp. LWH3-1.2 TaxID=3135256 RepID=UPI0034178D6D